MGNFDYIRLYGRSKGLSLFVANQLLLSTIVKKIENRVRVLEQLTNVLDNLSDSKNPLLQTTKAKKMLDLLQDFLGNKFYDITKRRFLSVFFVPFENRDRNAEFDFNTNSIAVFRTKDRKTNTPEYVFLHEFGHIVHASIFNSVNKVPQSFIEFNKMHTSFSKYTDREKLEIYADLFTVAVMSGTEFESCNPFLKTWSRPFVEQIKEYFVSELKT